MSADKPLGRKAYGSIGHLPGSRLGPGDHQVNPGHARICLEAFPPQRRDDVVTVTEKLDGSCVAVALLDDALVPLVRAGYRAETSPYEQHHLFVDWVRENEDRFRAVLREGQRVVGEWLAQAHGTIYHWVKEPFVAFDLMTGEKRLLRDEFLEAMDAGRIRTAPCLHHGGPLPLDVALARVGNGGSYCAQGGSEGVVYRVESVKDGRRYCDFLAKFVRPEKVDGCYLPEISGLPAVWNWRPE